MYLLRLSKGVKGYRLWNKESSGIKIIISRDVVFNEMKCFLRGLTVQVQRKILKTGA